MAAERVGELRGENCAPRIAPPESCAPELRGENCAAKSCARRTIIASSLSAFCRIRSSSSRVSAMSTSNISSSAPSSICFCCSVISTSISTKRSTISWTICASSGGAYRATSSAASRYAVWQSASRRRCGKWFLSEANRHVMPSGHEWSSPCSVAWTRGASHGAGAALPSDVSGARNEKTSASMHGWTKVGCALTSCCTNSSVASASSARSRQRSRSTASTSFAWCSRKMAEVLRLSSRMIRSGASPSRSRSSRYAAPSEWTEASAAWHAEDPMASVRVAGTSRARRTWCRRGIQSSALARSARLATSSVGDRAQEK